MNLSIWDLLIIWAPIFAFVQWRISHVSEEIKNLRTEIKEEIGGIRLEMASIRADFKEFREMWAEETKDFHARLAVIESHRKAS